MKNFRFILMLCSLVLFLVPKSNLFAQQNNGVSNCCTAKNITKDCCKSHNTSKEHQDSKHKKNCNGGTCCVNCNFSFSYINTIKNNTEIAFNLWLESKNQNFSYKNSTHTFGLKEIWQPPKIGS